MRRIELPAPLDSLFVPNCISQAATSVMSDLWSKSTKSTAIVIGETLPDAENKCEDIAALSEAIYPAIDIKFYSFDCTPLPTHPDGFEKTCDRLSLLSALINSQTDQLLQNRLLIATTLEAVLSTCPLLSSLIEAELLVKSGQLMSYEKFCHDLIEKLDYSSEVVCEEPGQFAIRGGLIDVYPVNANFPVRIDFFGDQVEEIRTYDPTSQRATGQVSEIRISSISPEYSSEKEGEFFNYLPDSVFWFFEEPENLVRLHPFAFHETGNVKSEKANLSYIWKRRAKISDFFLATSEINAGAGIFEKSPILTIELSPLIPELDDNSKIPPSIFNKREFNQVSSAILERISKIASTGFQIAITLGADSEKKRIESILEEKNLCSSEILYLKVGLHKGFVYQKGDKLDLFSAIIGKNHKGLIIATSREILGRERSRRPIRSRKATLQRKEVDQALDFSELIDGDLLVHLQHGICRFNSLGKIEQDGKSIEAITVEFADGILLHIPLQESHLLSRYIGLKKARPQLAKLGGKKWAKTKEAAELAAVDLAADLLRLQASRDSEHGYPFSSDDKWQKEFEDSFPYSETTDQLKSIQEVKQDMEAEKPMDRLVCGDVGYGKTEVAMRAAFKAIMDGKQVALLAPTTILCQQHLQSFSSRMCDFPITIEMLSRFRTKTQQRKIIDGLKSGGIDMVIGTHRIFSKDLNFKDLGLLIIDEEQRFGVEHKEKLKKLKTNLDVLTLSATPIPRTLYFAMVGVRSFSTIETPPINRRPIRTEVVRGSDDILKKAVDLELRRGGQIFYLHNRVKTINAVARKLQALFPKLRLAVGHGQMTESELESIMVEFVAGQFDMLICTTIIESGLDIPNCNTIIIEDADKFGLSQLYQLRGRVGRFTKQAYAYLLINPHLPIRDKARKRLSALKNSSSMGAGFKIALRDLELRGAGNLLGSEQSGHIAGVGFEMYCKLLKESVSRLKGEEISLRPSAVVRLDFLHPDETILEHDDTGVISSCFPVKYMGEPRLRIEFYRKLALVFEVEQLQEFREELVDRFGPIPKPVEALLLETEIKCLAQQAGFDCIANDRNHLLCRLVRRKTQEGIKYFKVMGNLPILKEKDSFLKLKEIIRFLKIHLHGIK